MAGRAPTAAEQATWTHAIGTCGATVDDLAVSLLPTSQSSTDARLVRLYLAYFKRPPDPDGFTYWKRQLESGRGLINAALKFARSSEFTRTYGSLSNAAFVDLVYQNVLGRAGDASGRSYWITRLDRGTKNRGEVMINFSESTENTTKKADHVAVFRLYRAMLARFPGKTAYLALLDPVLADTSTLEDVARTLRHDPAYAARF